MKGEAASPGFRITREEIYGPLGDLGTFLPLTFGYITQCGLTPAPVFFAGLKLSLPSREYFLVGFLTVGLILAVSVTIGFLVGILFWGIFNGKKNGFSNR
jgi:hypothetical protein